MNGRELDRCRREWLEHPERRAVLSAFPTPMPPTAAALIILRESGWNKRAIASNVYYYQGGIDKGEINRSLSFYEIGYTQRTLTFDGSRGTCKDANVDPWDLLSSVYGMQHEYQGCLTKWIHEAKTLGVSFPRFTDVGELITMMHAPYSMGWGQIRALVKRAKTLTVGTGFRAMISACLRLKDTDLPHLGLQSAQKIRKRIKRLVEFADDCESVAPLPKEIKGFLSRTAEVRPMPPVHSVLQIAQGDAERRK